MRGLHLTTRGKIVGLGMAFMLGLATGPYTICTFIA